jgi:hypothetical protein
VAGEVGSELDAAFEAWGGRLCPRCGAVDPVDFEAQLVCRHCGATWQADIIAPRQHPPYGGPGRGG